MNDTFTTDDLALLHRVAAELVEPVEPPAEVRQHILDAIRHRPHQLDETIPGEHESLTVRASEGKWVTVADGARCKKLASDRERNTITMLLELEPHAILPAHDHRGSETSYVIRGSCRIGAVALYAGDFHRVDTGAHHGNVIASAEGCLLLLTVDRSDHEAA